MKVIKIQLADSIYEELEAMLEKIGQTEQTFYEAFTKSALKEWRTPFITKES